MTKKANMVVKVALSEKAMVAEKELKIAQERVAMAEAKAGKPSNSTYTKLFQTEWQGGRLKKNRVETQGLLSRNS